MVNKFELTLGLRFLRAKQKNKFVSFIAIASIIGIALGVAALITVLSVMNGFQSEIRNKIVGVTSHMELTDSSGTLSNWQKIAQKAKTSDIRILNYAPYVNAEGLVSFDNNVGGVLIRGIDPKIESSVDNINKFMTLGNYYSLVPHSFNIVIGRELALSLGVDVGDKIALVTPNGQITPTGMLPRIKRFKVSGIFDSHMYEYDSALVLVNISDARALFGMDKSDVTGVRLRVSDIFATQDITAKLGNVLPENVVITDWISEHQSYFAAVSMEKKMMFVILALIVSVAAFNLISTLVMIVHEKNAEIAILRTMGAKRSSIIKIFMLQGVVSGVVGTIVGTIVGLLLAHYIGNIVHVIEMATHTKLISADVYLINYLPSRIMLSDVLATIAVSLVLSVLATIYPAFRASCVDPVEALRYE